MKINKKRKNIIVIEPSEIIYEGLSSSIAKSEYNYSFFYLDSLKEIDIFHLKHQASVALINPSLIQNQVMEFNKIKNQFPDIYWIGIVYAFFDQSLLKKFNDTISITDNVSVILKKISKVYKHKSAHTNHDEEITERETDVLKWLARGLSNKEVADRLNISIHTVNTHRKNIMDKTGIRSLAGLTIYAVSKGIISME